MSIKQRLKAQLKQARNYSEGLLASFHTPEQWTHQVHPRANHALWFAGHMGVVDNFLISVIDRERAQPREGFQETFGMGSQPTSDPAKYPAPEEVLAYMRDRRQALLALLESLTEEDLSNPTPTGTPAFLPDYGSLFQLAAWHEGLHSGQVSVAHRALGNPPIVS
jgi:uncharacterized damage-inducible protein DinB